MKNNPRYNIKISRLKPILNGTENKLIVPWYIYIVKCRDGLFYTGITKDLKRRVKEHSSGNGCRFTKYRAPVRLMYSEKTISRSLALKREAAIKRLSRREKKGLFKKAKSR